MPVDTFTRERLAQIRDDMDAAMAHVAQRHGITIKLGTMRFDKGMARGAIEMKNATGEQQEVNFFRSVAQLEQLDPDRTGPLGERLVGFKKRSPKMPWIYLAKDGTRYKCSYEKARRMFGVNAMKKKSEGGGDHAGL